MHPARLGTGRGSSLDSRARPLALTSHRRRGQHAPRAHPHLTSSISSQPTPTAGHPSNSPIIAIIHPIHARADQGARSGPFRSCVLDTCRLLASHTRRTRARPPPTPAHPLHPSQGVAEAAWNIVRIIEHMGRQDGARSSLALRDAQACARRHAGHRLVGEAIGEEGGVELLQVRLQLLRLEAALLRLVRRATILLD